MKNEEVINVFACIKQVLESKEIKQAIPDSGKIVYAFVKMRSKFAKAVDNIAEEESNIKNGINEGIKAIRSSDKSEVDKNTEIDKLIIQGNKDIKSLYSEKEVEVDVDLHKISIESAEIIQKYLDEAATVGLFTHLILEGKE